MCEGHATDGHEEGVRVSADEREEVIMIIFIRILNNLRIFAN